MIMGLDLSSVNTGYSVFTLPISPTLIETDSAQPILININPSLVTFGNITPNKKLNDQAKLELIYNLINNLIVKYEVKVVVIEDQHFANNAKTLKLLSRISGVAMLAAQQNNCNVFLYPALSIKKSFTGNGKAKKDEMVNKAVEQFNLDPGSVDDNAADSMGAVITYINKELRKEN